MSAAVFTFKIKNYRSFHGVPATFEIGPGFTAFIGPNNAGKSSLLRLFFELRQLGHLLGPGEPLNNLLRGGGGGVSAAGAPDSQAIFSDQTSGDLTIDIELPNAGVDTHGVPHVTRVSLAIAREGSNCTLKLYNSGGPVTPNPHAVLDGNAIVAGNRDIPLVSFADLATVSSLFAKSIYVPAFRNALRLEGPDLYDIKVGRSLVALWRVLKTGNIRADNRLARTITRDLGAIFQLPDLEIDAADDSTSFRITVDGHSFPLDEVGAGFAQFLVVLINVASRSPALILIDEPEQNLHPSLQVDFLTRLAAYSPGGVAFATHSLGLARTVADRIYSVQKGANGGSAVRQFEGTRHLPELLGELSYSGYYDLGYRSILLVEGVTEIRTIQQWLRKLGKDNTVVLLPLGGSALVRANVELELSEVRRLADKVYALVDSDRSQDGGAIKPDADRFQAICKKVGIDCHVLELRALENYLSESAVQKVNGPTARALRPFEAWNEAPRAWTKAENWRIAHEMTKDEILATDVGQFLNGLAPRE